MPLNLNAAFYFARCLESGLGCDTNPSAAETLFAKILPPLTERAIAGDATAQFAVAECLYNGYGIEEDESASRLWYKSAALAGHAEAKWAAEAFKLI